eukprot:scaffold12097_cov21-Tisochrysis_lutea.AAC.1
MQKGMQWEVSFPKWAAWLERVSRHQCGVEGILPEKCLSVAKELCMCSAPVRGIDDHIAFLGSFQPLTPSKSSAKLQCKQQP